MSNMSPFEIRLELLKMAKDMLSEEYYGKKDVVSNDWHSKVAMAERLGQPSPDHPAYPAYPKETDIITKAKLLNSFVSNEN
jgi:hypothetical protein